MTLEECVSGEIGLLLGVAPSRLHPLLFGSEGYLITGKTWSMIIKGLIPGLQRHA